jgi:hypothetical protein
MQIIAQNKDGWTPILGLYSSIARDGQRLSKLSEKRMVLKQTEIPYDKYVEFMES